MVPGLGRYNVCVMLGSGYAARQLLGGRGLFEWFPAAAGHALGIFGAGLAMSVRLGLRGGRYDAFKACTAAATSPRGGVSGRWITMGLAKVWAVRWPYAAGAVLSSSAGRSVAGASAVAKGVKPGAFAEQMAP